MADFTKGQKVYVSSSDSRQEGFDAVVTSVGRVYITVSDDYGRKYRFDTRTLVCVDWSIYELEESRELYVKRKEMENKLFYIKRNENFLCKVLSESEIEDIAERIRKLKNS